jgi:hypothetical protein
LLSSVRSSGAGYFINSFNALEHADVLGADVITPSAAGAHMESRTLFEISDLVQDFVAHSVSVEGPEVMIAG